MQQNAPIGMFDSGLGGLSIWREIKLRLPEESTMYVSDGSNAPYGTKSPNFIRQRAIEITEFLLERGCKLVVVACNTATTNAIQELRQSFKVPFIGIEPAIKPAALHTRTGRVGVLATKGTLSSHLFHRTKDLHTQGISIFEQEGTGLVEAIEAGKLQTEEVKELLKSHLSPLLEADIDVLVLGCTHYPFLIPLLEDLLPNKIQIIDSGAAVARQTEHVLESMSLKVNDQKLKFDEFLTSGDGFEMQTFLKEMGYSVVVHPFRT